MIEIHEGSTNVYADLGVADAGTMWAKAQLVAEMEDMIRARGWTPPQAADALGLAADTLANVRRGHFRGISEARLMDCLARLGRNAHRVVDAEHETPLAVASAA